MHSIKDFLSSGAVVVKGAALVAALAIVMAAPYGCSKKEEAPKQQAPAAKVSSADKAREHFNAGVQLAMKGDFEGAIKEYEETIKLNPDSAETYNNLGFAYFDTGDLDKSIENHSKAIEINPKLANGYYGLALAYEKKEDKAAAIQNWNEFLKLTDPHSKWAQNAKQHLDILEGRVKPEEAAPAEGAAPEGHAK